MTRNEQSFSNFDTPIMNFFLQNFEREIDSTNWYAYCGNDPINFIDPLGLCSESTEKVPNLIENIIKEEDLGKVTLGSGFDATGVDAWNSNPGGKHSANDIKALKDENGNQYTDITIVSPYDYAYAVHIPESSNPTGGNAILLIELDEKGNMTENGMYVGHVKDLDTVDNWSVVSKGDDIATMGSSGTAVIPEGFVHAHVELRTQTNWNDSTTRTKEREQGDIVLK